MISLWVTINELLVSSQTKVMCGARRETILARDCLWLAQKVLVELNAFY